MFQILQHGYVKLPADGCVSNETGETDETTETIF